MPERLSPTSWVAKGRLRKEALGKMKCRRKFSFIMRSRMHRWKTFIRIIHILARATYQHALGRSCDHPFDAKKFEGCRIKLELPLTLAKGGGALGTGYFMGTLLPARGSFTRCKWWYTSASVLSADPFDLTTETENLVNYDHTEYRESAEYASPSSPEVMAETRPHHPSQISLPAQVSSSHVPSTKAPEQLSCVRTQMTHRSRSNAA